MSLSSHKYSLFFLAIVALAACSGNVQEVNNQNQGVELNQNEQKTLLDEASKDSESDLLESFESLSNIESSLSELTNVAEGDVDNSSLIADKLLDEEPIITFDVPDDVSAEYSNPVMITGASLSLSEESVDKECGGLTYQVAVPTMKSIFTSSASNNICGETTISICMRMSLKSVKKGNKSFIYKKLPEIKIKLPCSDESFIGAGFEVKTISDDSSTIGLEIEAKRVVSFMKLFNATSCDKEQEWQAINNVVAALPVTWSAEGTSPVSIKLMDSYGYESKCISQVAHQSKLEEKTPTETETLTETDTLTETSTNTASSCLENETNLIAANIKKGVSISGVTGTGELSLALCTSDGQTNCIATDEFNAEEASSILAANIKSGSTIGGVAGSAIVESRSDCSADGSESCIANASYKATLVAGLAAKVVSGQTVAGVSGTAISQKFDCSSDGQVNCAASSTYKAVLSTGLAAKIVLGETVGGVAGTTQEETVHTNCTGANQTGCLATSNYKTMDLSSADDGGALDLTSSNFNTRMASSSVFEYWDDLGARHTNIGAADLTAANIETGTEILGVNGSANPPLDCSSISAGTWLLVPGDPDFGTNDFCIMKYEAKNDGNGIPESVATSWPWGDISQLDAITACASIGKGYHLITNDEWMTVASNIANVDSNWSGGTVGSGHLYRGHSDNSPNYACVADVDDTKAYVEGSNCNGLAAGGAEDDETTQRRTHTLSTGEIIWDLSGNLKEWTSYFNDTDKPSAGGGWMQYNQPVVGSSTLPLSDLIPTSAVKSFWNDSWSTANSIGRYNSGSNGAGGAMARGERWSGFDYAGVFTADLFYTQDNSANTPGFRCTVSVP